MHTVCFWSARGNGVRSWFPDEDTEAAILNICARVDQLPLGIELAAARVSIMSPNEIVASLDAHLGELGWPRRSTPAHHRSVRAAVEWSYALLDPIEQAAFRSLAVFVGEFDADAARAVAPGMSLDVLARLVDKSLITVVPAGRHRTRYRLLDTMRAYASEQLASANEMAAARARHLRYFSAIGIPVEHGFMSARVVSLLEPWAADYGNVRAALEWAAASEPCVAMRLLAETRDLFFILGQADGSRLAEMILQRCPERNRHRAWLMIAAGHLAFQLGNMADAAGLMTQAAELSVELGERAAEAAAHLFLGMQHMFAGAPDKARGHLTTARAIAPGDGRSDRRGAKHGRTRTHLLHGRRACPRSRAARGGAGDGPGGPGPVESGCRRTCISASWPSRQAIRRPRRRTSARRSNASGPTATPPCFRWRWSARRACWPGAIRQPHSRWWPQRGPCELATAESSRRSSGRSLNGPAPPRPRESALTRSGCGGAGSRLTVDDAIALAFGTTRARTSHPLGISEREIDVVRLVAEGLSNKEIAGRLHLSVRTVESHVRHMLTKTGLVNRTQLATWARERGEAECQW